MAKKRSQNTVFHGVPAAPGIAVGPARRLEDPSETVEERVLTEDEVEPEVERFQDALERTRRELTRMRAATGRDLDEETARIFDVQLQVLEDPLAVARTEKAIRAEHRNAEFLFRRHMMEMWDGIKALPDAYFSERAVDLLDVKQRVLRHLTGNHTVAQDRKGVLIGRELAPSDAVALEPGKVLGFATDAGGTTSHATIMARARGIPAVVGVGGLFESVREGDMVAVDGFRGTVEVNPTPATVARLRTRKQKFSRLEKRHAKLSDLPAETPDGHSIRLSANMELPAELDFILKRGADGIGLFRTEFFFMWSHRAPTEDEQTEVYRDITRRVGPGRVVIRALDVGGDKLASYMGMVRERNPFFGMRGIRFLLAHPRLFATQLRAILRASPAGTGRILFPMLSSFDEFKAIRRQVKLAMSTLRRRRVDFDPEPRLGVMVEVPSAVMMADELARHADFLSVGSNDLIQYLLAIDRNNPSLQDLYRPHHPAVLRALSQTVEAGHRHGKPVSICGEMAGDPLSIPLLVGLGFDQLSVAPYLIPDIKQTVRAVRAEECRALVSDALRCAEAAEVTALIHERLGSRFSDLLRLIEESNGRAARPAPRRAGRRPVRRTS